MPGIDTFRAIAILAVICIHTEPFRALGRDHAFYEPASILINSMTRFAVPFFFISSGYFFSKKFSGDRPRYQHYVKYVRRLLLVFAAWSVIYLVVPTSLREIWQAGPWQAFYSHMGKVLAGISMTDLLFQGTKIHLWFLTALTIAVSFVFLLHRGWARWLLYSGAIALYAVALLAGAYASTPLGIDLGFNTRNGPFFSTLFVVIGVWLSRRDVRGNVYIALALTLAGLVIQTAEAGLLYKVYGVSYFEHDFLIGTLPLSLGITLFALSCSQFGKGTYFSAAGKYALGIYLSHFLVLEFSRPASYLIRGPIWELLFPVMIFAMSYLLVLLLSKIPYVRNIVV